MSPFKSPPQQMADLVGRVDHLERRTRHLETALSEAVILLGQVSIFLPAYKAKEVSRRINRFTTLLRDGVT